MILAPAAALPQNMQDAPVMVREAYRFAIVRDTPRLLQEGQPLADIRAYIGKS